MNQRYDILLGGGSGLKPRMGRLVERSVPANEVKYKIEALLSSYILKRESSEDLGEFCTRHTPAELKTMLNATEGKM